MFRPKQNDRSTFWISYADLMAGLLFVFILLIGAIISKSIIMRQTLAQKEDRLHTLSARLEEEKRLLESLREKIKTDRLTIKSKDETIQKQLQTIALKEEEIKKLKKMLLEANARADVLSQKVVLVQNILSDQNKTLQKIHKKLEAYQGKVLVLSHALEESNRTIKQKEEEILALLNALDEKKTRYDALIAKLKEQKAKIKSLTGIRLKVISALKEALGDKIEIDKKSGTLTLASNILFDRGSAVLRPEAQEALSEIFERYIVALMEDPRIAPYLQRIVIEGHTDSDGGYLYNLKLSQERALAVLNHLLVLPVSKRYNLEPLLSAEGRAYMDKIMREGVEDKNASRRIEIKFQLKNNEAMEEIERILDAP